MASLINTTSLKDPELRNLIRGAISNQGRKTKLTTLNHARRILKLEDAVAFSILLIESGLDEEYFGPRFPQDSSKLYRVNYREEINPEIELVCQLTRALYDKEKIIRISTLLGKINEFLINRDLIAAATLCETFISEYGLSALMVRKAIFIYSKCKDVYGEDVKSFEDQYAVPLLQKFFSESDSGYYNTYLNLIFDVSDNDLDFVDLIYEQNQSLRDVVSNSNNQSAHSALLRRVLYPANFYSLIDPAGLLFFSSSSIVDVFADICVASNFLPDDASVPRLLLSPEVQQAKDLMQVSDELLEAYLQADHSESRDQAAYRVSGALTEIDTLAKWRHSLDKEMCLREAWPCPREPVANEYFPSDLRLRHLCKPPNDGISQFRRFDNSHCGSFIRTFAVMSRLNAGESLTDLKPGDARILLSQTTGFSRFLSVKEIIEFRDKSTLEGADIVTFLAFVLLNQKRPDEDAAFDMRMAFQKVVIEKFQSNIIGFLNWLHTRTPDLCHVIIDLCDITFLERLYIINQSYADVLKMRELIFRWAASKFKRSDYDTAADRLALDSKVRQIRGEIDDTRIFVDEIRYQQWAIDNLNPLLRRYERVQAVTPARPSPKQSSGTNTTQNDHWFTQACELAFEQFCHDKIFGIDSYLSRRIRHGTLAGTLAVPIQSRIQKFRERNAHNLSLEDIAFLDNTYQEYVSVIDFIRDDLLHFRSNGKHKGLIYRGAQSTKERKGLQTNFLAKFDEYLNDGFATSDLTHLFLAHCWDLLQQDMYRIQNELRDQFNSRIRPLLRHVASQNDGQEWKTLSHELDQEADSLFSNLLKWFTKPESASLIVSIGELLAVVAEEVGGYHPDYRKRWRLVEGGTEQISGLTYQTVYDLFFIFFDNIAKHADPAFSVPILSNFVSKSDSPFAMLNIQITSKNKKTDSDLVVSQRIVDALKQDTESDSMTREGRSGIGKAKRIIESYSEHGEFGWKVDDGYCVIRFSIPVVLVGATK